MPDWLTVNSDLSQAKVMVTVDYNITEEDTAPVVDDAEANRLASNNLAEAKESETYTGNKSGKFTKIHVLKYKVTMLSICHWPYW